MLNCTDLECILHHHHYYAHLHHLQHGTHHVQDADHHGAMSTESDDINETIQEILNGTNDSELSSLSHVDAPNDSLYMIFGVVIAMVLVAVIIVLLAVTISKLRKREEHSNSVHPTDVVLQTGPTTVQTPALATITHSTTIPVQTHPAEPLAYRGQFLWQYTPPPPSQYNLYSNNQDSLVQNLAVTKSTDQRTGLVRCFRKNLGCHWKRLVHKKPEPDVYTIPAELKPQLKQIYVY